MAATTTAPQYSEVSGVSPALVGVTPAFCLFCPMVPFHQLLLLFVSASCAAGTQSSVPVCVPRTARISARPRRRSAAPGKTTKWPDFSFASSKQRPPHASALPVSDNAPLTFSDVPSSVTGDATV